MVWWCVSSLSSYQVPLATNYRAIARTGGVEISGFESWDTPINFDFGIKTEVDLLLVTSY